MTNPGNESNANRAGRLGADDKPAVTLIQHGEVIEFILENAELREIDGKLYPVVTLPVDRCVAMLTALKNCVERALKNL